MKPTRIALISDLHGDVHALQAALQRSDELGCERILCAGNLIDYGLFPDETLDLLQRRHIPCVRGNHDRWAVHVGAKGHLADRSGWALSRRSLRFLARLPTSLVVTIEGVRIAVHHARPGSDTVGIMPGEATDSELHGLLDRAGANVLVVGHTHVPFALPTPGGIVINPGSLLCNPAADYGDVPSCSGAVAPSPTGGTFGLLGLPSLDFTIHSVRTGAAWGHRP